MLFQQLQEAHLLLDLHGNFCGLATEGFTLFLNVTIKNKDLFFLFSLHFFVQKAWTGLTNHTGDKVIQKIFSGLYTENISHICSRYFSQPQPPMQGPFPQLPGCGLSELTPQEPIAAEDHLCIWCHPRGSLQPLLCVSASLLSHLSWELNGR